MSGFDSELYIDLYLEFDIAAISAVEMPAGIDLTEIEDWSENETLDFSLAVEPSGRLCMLVDALADGEQGVIERSTNLRDWIPLQAFGGNEEPALVIMGNESIHQPGPVFYRLRSEELAPERQGTVNFLRRRSTEDAPDFLIEPRENR